MPDCVACGLQGIRVMGRLGDNTEYLCAACGAFVFTNTAVATLPAFFENHPDARPLLSHLLRIRNPQANENTAPISDAELRQLVEGNKLPTPAEQCDNLISVLGSRTIPGQHIVVITDEIRSTIGARSNEGVLMVARHLFNTGSIAVMGGARAFDMGALQATLTVPGWTRYRDIQTASITTRTAFMAMQFDDTDAGRAFRDAFAPAANDCGFTLQRLDEQQPAGLIDDQLRVRIRTSAFVVADVTRNNLGAYWEAGFAEGLGKPVIYTCEAHAFEEGASHFDTNHHLTVPWTLDNLPDARSRLKATIRATLPALAKMND